jgi:hypothetical protein
MYVRVFYLCMYALCTCYYKRIYMYVFSYVRWICDVFYTSICMNSMYVRNIGWVCKVLMYVRLYVCTYYVCSIMYVCTYYVRVCLYVEQ